MFRKHILKATLGVLMGIGALCSSVLFADAYSNDTRYCRFGKDDDTRYCRFGKDDDTRYCRFGKDDDTRYCQLDAASEDKLYLEASNIVFNSSDIYYLTNDGVFHKLDQLFCDETGYYIFLQD